MRALAGKTLIALMVAAAAGCSPYVPEPKHVELKASAPSAVSHTASLSDTTAVPASSDLFICREPPPDATFQQAESADFSFSLIAFGDEEGTSEGEEENSKEREMQGRTPSVPVARELMYRLCEMSRGAKLDKQDVLKLYAKTLAVIEKVTTTEAENTTITIGSGLKAVESDTSSDVITETIDNTRQVVSLPPPNAPAQGTARRTPVRRGTAGGFVAPAPTRQTAPAAIPAPVAAPSIQNLGTTPAQSTSGVQVCVPGIDLNSAGEACPEECADISGDLVGDYPQCAR